MSVNASREMNIELKNKEPQNFEGRYFPFLKIKAERSESSLQPRQGVVQYSNNTTS